VNAGEDEWTAGMFHGLKRLRLALHPSAWLNQTRARLSARGEGTTVRRL